MVDSIIFDLDGTLWDSTGEIIKCWKKTLPDLPKNILELVMGKTPEEIAHTFSIPIEIVQGVQRREIDWLMKNPVAPYIGVTLMLQYLGDRFPMFIVSNCQPGYIECFLTSNNLADFFRDHKCSEDGTKAGNIKSLMDEYGLQRPLVVGDTQDDLEAAEANNLPFIWAAYGFGFAKRCKAIIYKPIDLMLKVQDV